jgi:hypothetical protein
VSKTKLNATSQRHDYDKFIADWMARRQANPDGERPQDRIGFIRKGMESTLREADLSAEELAHEMAHFDAAAMRFLSGALASAPAEQAPTASYDFDQSFRDWAENPENRSGRLADPSRRMGSANAVVTTSRSKLEAELREEGMPDTAAAGELARYDEAAARFLDAERQRWSEALKSRKDSLGFWGWVGALWTAGSVAVGAFGLMIALSMPLREAGRLDMTALIWPAAAVSVLVFVAALLMARKLIRDYREVGFILFWAPMILGSQMLGVFPAALTKMVTDSMGPDFLPLALPLAILTGGALVVASLWLMWRHRPGRISHREPVEIHPLTALLLAGFSVLFFTIGARVMFEWGPGPSLVVGFFVTGLFMRMFVDREIGFGFILIVALPLALLAAEMPPGNLSALTILVLALALAALVAAVTTLRGKRRTSFFSGLTAAALALLLVIAPTGPSPALWLTGQLGHPLRPLSEAAMELYTRIFEIEQGHAVLSAIDGYRSGAAEVRLAQFEEVQNSIEMTVDIRNIGERGIANIRVDLIGDGEIAGNFDVCARPVIDRDFYPPIWPGDAARVTLYWILPSGCPASRFAEVAGRVRSGIETRGRHSAIPSLVLETSVVDPVARFREDARAWLGL